MYKYRYAHSTIYILTYRERERERERIATYIVRSPYTGNGTASAVEKIIVQTVLE